MQSVGVDVVKGGRRRGEPEGLDGDPVSGVVLMRRKREKLGESERVRVGVEWEGRQRRADYLEGEKEGI